MTDTLPAALRAASDGPVRVQTALQRAARRLRRAAVPVVAPVGTALPPLLLDGGLGPLLSERLRALLTPAAAPPAEEEITPAMRPWEARQAARFASQPASLAGSAAPTPHLASVLPVLPSQSSFAGAVDRFNGGARHTPAATPSSTMPAHGLSGAALLRDRITRALAAPSIERRSMSSPLGLHSSVSSAPSTAAPHAADAPGPHGAMSWQRMTPAETAAALRAFAEGKPIAGRAFAEEALQVTDFASSVAAPAASGAPPAHGAGSRSTLAPSAHFSSQGFAFADTEAAAPLAPDALADSLATILRAQARAHGIELP